MHAIIHYSDLETKLIATQKDIKNLKLKQRYSYPIIVYIVFLYRSSANHEYDMCHSLYNNQPLHPEVTVNAESPIV